VPREEQRRDGEVLAARAGGHGGDRSGFHAGNDRVPGRLSSNGMVAEPG
jgi:hypothetical protein